MRGSVLRQTFLFRVAEPRSSLAEARGPKDADVSDLDTIAPNRLLRESANRVCMATFANQSSLTFVWRLNRLWECVSQHRLSLSGRTPLLSVHSFGGLVPYEPTA